MLNVKQRLFCQYLVGECKGNAAEAAIKAGYSPKTAAFNTSKLLKREDVRDYITKLNDEITKNYTEKVAEITKYEIASIAEIQAFWTSIFKDEEQKVSDRLRASELLAKSKGVFNNEGW